MTWVETQVLDKLQAPVSLFQDYVGIVTVTTLLEANELPRRALVRDPNLLRTHVHESVCDVDGPMLLVSCLGMASFQESHL